MEDILEFFEDEKNNNLLQANTDVDSRLCCIYIYIYM